MEKIIFKNFPYRITPLNDRNLNQLQTNVENALNEKVDKVEGKGLSTNDFTTTEKNKLGGIEPGANKYTHPASHPASIITQDENNRFVSDDEKSDWNNKLDKTGGTISGDVSINGSLEVVGNKIKFNGLTLFEWVD